MPTIFSVKKLTPNPGNNLIPCIHLKGISLSYYLYHDCGLRPIADLDILVKPANFLEANNLLLKCGYVRSLSEENLKEKILRQVAHHCCYYQADRRITVELHRKYVPKNRSNFTGDDSIWSREQSIFLEGQALHILSPEDLLIYLCIHASKEFWASLLHVNDIASLIVKHPNLNWQFIIDFAKSNRIFSRVLISCALVSFLLSVSLPQIIEEEIERKGARGEIFYAVLRNLVGADHQMKTVWSTRFWQDLNLAESWQDRMVIVGYKGINVLATVADRLLQPFRGGFVS